MTDDNSSEPSYRNSSWELWFICVGLLLVCFVYRMELVSFSSAKWATVSAWMLMATWPESDLDFVSWKGVYVVFLFVALGFELTAFVLPMLFFHQQMKDQKRQLLPLGDLLSAELSHLQLERMARLTTQRNPEIDIPFDARSDGAEPGPLVDQIALLESLPTWPLAPQIRNRFAVGNLALLAPGALELSQTFMDAFSSGLK